MAPTSHGRSGPQGRDSFTNGHPSNGPPPSTLAAQLVLENISPSARSTRPDETAELKKFFATIEKVKNHPELLKTSQERTEHNHMLIYVSARVALEGLRWGDPFADRAQLTAGALRTINFLKVTIKETPEVLLLSSPGHDFLFRGQEPFWVWILPKVLKLLGHDQCLTLTTAVESFFYDLYHLMCQHGSLWAMIPQFLHYVRGSFTGEPCV
jgi:serine/threonine-protein kinase ATR